MRMILEPIVGGIIISLAAITAKDIQSWIAIAAGVLIGVGFVIRWVWTVSREHTVVTKDLDALKSMVQDMRRAVEHQQDDQKLWRRQVSDRLERIDRHVDDLATSTNHDAADDGE